METDRLRQFQVIVETGNLRRAAEILAISHSGLSKSMKALQTEVGITLFHPSGRGIVISDDGMKFYGRSKRFLDELDRFLGHGETQPIRSLRFGSFEIFTSHFVGVLLNKYLKDLSMEVHELGPGTLEEALALDKVDVGITYEPIPRKGVDYIQVCSIQVGAYGLKGCFSDEDVSMIPFVVPVNPLEGAPSGVKHRDAWPDERIPRNIRYRVDSLATGLEIVRLGLAAIFMPQFVAKLHNKTVGSEFRLAPLKLPRVLCNVKRDVFIVKRESTSEDRTIRLIARALREVCPEG